MTKSKGNMYGFVTHTWNPICGSCCHNCTYCYMKRWKLNPVHLNESMLNQNLGNGRFIFVGSGTDMFAQNVPSEWIERVLCKCMGYDNEYLFQSKNPERFYEFKFPYKSILCTTIESNRRYPEMGDAPSVESRVEWLEYASKSGWSTMITIEPIMDFDLDPLIDLIGRCNPIQVNIGADSKNHSLEEPPVWKIEELIKNIERITTVFLKDNIKRILK